MRFEKLGNIASIQIGKTPKRDNASWWGKGNLWVSISDLKEKVIIKTKEQITELAIKECGCKRIPKDTLLMSFKLSIGKVAFAGCDLYTNEAICGLTIKDKNKIFPEYLYYVLKHTKFQGSNVAVKGATLNTASLKDIKIPIPEKLEDQIRIASLLSKAEALIKQRKESIDLLDEYLKSTFLDMFGAGDKSNYPIKTLNEVSIKITDGEHGTVERLEQGRLYLMARNITRSNELDFEQVSYISEDAHQKIFNRCNPQKDDLLMVCVGATIGKVALVPEMDEFSIARSVALIKPNHKLIDSRYLLWFFNTDFGIRQIKSGSNEAAQAGLYTGNLKKIKIPLPPIEIQHQFASIVNKTELINSQYQSSLAELENLYDSLSQKAFKGELNLERGEEMLMAAEPKETYKFPVQSTIPANKRGFAKQVLGGKIVKMFKDDKQFTHIKFQKLQYLAEQIIEEDLDWNYYRQMAGPYDNKFMHSVFNRLEKNSWYRKSGGKYYPLEKVTDIDKYYENYFGDKSEKLNNLFGLLQRGTEKFCEAVATIYAVWNNHIILKQEFNKERIKADFFDWSNRKTAVFTEEEFEKALVWMQNHGIVPTGFGGLIKEKK